MKPARRFSLNVYRRTFRNILTGSPSASVGRYFFSIGVYATGLAVASARLTLLGNAVQQFVLRPVAGWSSMGFFRWA